MIGEAGLSTCAVVDVLDGMGVTAAVLPTGLTPQSGTSALVYGAAYTVSWVPVRKQASIHAPGPSTWQQVRAFLVPELTDGRGKVYVGGAGELLTHAALAGGMSVTYLLEQLGFEAVVLGGAVRDRAVVEAMNRPVIASNFVPTDTQGAYRVSETGTECRIGDVRIVTGDWVFTDGNGTVVVREDIVEEVLKRAVAVEDAEASILRQLRAGRPLPAIVDEGGQI
jgi:regulator of RNase E activity RraA